MLRALYNLILLIEGIYLSSGLIGVFGVWDYIAKALMFAITANAFFSLGPLSEIYLSLVGIRIGRVRYVLFGVGLLFSFLVVLAIASTICHHVESGVQVHPHP
jgi:hypothetical protein